MQLRLAAASELQHLGHRISATRARASHSILSSPCPSLALACAALATEQQSDHWSSAPFGPESGNHWAGSHLFLTPWCSVGEVPSGVHLNRLSRGTAITNPCLGSGRIRRCKHEPRIHRGIQGVSSRKAGCSLSKRSLTVVTCCLWRSCSRGVRALHLIRAARVPGQPYLQVVNSAYPDLQPLLRHSGAYCSSESTCAVDWLEKVEGAALIEIVPTTDLEFSLLYK